MIFFLGSAFLTSRTTSIFITLIFVYLILKEILYSGFKLKKLIIAVISLGIFSRALFLYVLPIFLATIELGFLEPFRNLADEQSIYSYSRDNPIELLKNFIVIPDSNIGLIFGLNRFPKSDSGYIQLVNTIGMIGLSITLIYYKIIYRFFGKNIYGIIGKFIVLITLIFSIKNQYFFTRGIFELLIIILILNRCSNYNLKNYDHQ